jgi:nucleoside-diphosphate-sugar epimerase
MGPVEDLHPMKGTQRIVITGATGFVGNHLVRRLHELGAMIRVLVRPRADIAPLRGERIEFFYGDLSDAASLDGLCKDVDQIFHLAATQQIGLSQSRFFEINVGGTRRLFDQAIQNGVRRVVFVSSGGIHRNDRGEPADEESPLRKTNRYFRSKIEAEAMARSLFRDDPGCLTVVRPGAVYGPGDLRLLKLFRAVTRGRFVMIGTGMTRVHPVYIDDLIDGLLLAGSDLGRGETFLLSGPGDLSLRDWVGEMARAAGQSPPRWMIPARPVYVAAALCEFLCRPFGIVPPLNRTRLGFFLNHRSYDLAKARTLLGYEPRISVEEGTRRTLDWYKIHGWL